MITILRTSIMAIMILLLIIAMYRTFGLSGLGIYLIAAAYLAWSDPARIRNHKLRERAKLDGTWRHHA